MKVEIDENIIIDQEFDEFNICSMQFNRLKELVKLWSEHANK